MLAIHLGLLWCLVCVHIVGAACLFSRLFRRESPWFGFVLPALALVLVMNFIEHGVGFSTLRWALPVTFLGLLWTIVSALQAEGLLFLRALRRLGHGAPHGI
jgi:hypothetical protein